MDLDLVPALVLLQEPVLVVPVVPKFTKSVKVPALVFMTTGITPLFVNKNK